MIADAIGKHTVKKRTYGRSAGKSTMSCREEDEHWIKPHDLRELPKHTAIIKHCERHFRRLRLAPSTFIASPKKSSINRFGWLIAIYPAYSASAHSR